MGDSEGGRERLCSLKAHRQSKGMLEVYLELSWARLFLFNLSFITVTARLIFSKIFFKKKQTFFGGGYRILPWKGNLNTV